MAPRDRRGFPTLVREAIWLAGTFLEQERGCLSGPRIFENPRQVQIISPRD